MLVSHFDSTGKNIKVGDTVRFRGHEYTIKQFLRDGPPASLLFNEVIENTTEVPTEFKVDLVEEEVMTTKEKAAFLMGFGAAIDHSFSISEREEMHSHLVTAVDLLEGDAGNFYADRMSAYVTRLMMKWVVVLTKDIAETYDESGS